MRKITFDIETRNTFQDVGSDKAVDLDISLLCIHDSKTDEYDTFMHDDLDRLWPILEQADILVGYNSDHFDIPLLNKYYPGELSRIKSLDIMREVYETLGRRLKLDAIARGTLGEKKSADGIQSLRWWKAGEIEKVRSYCLKDVEITKKIFDYALANKVIRYKDLGGMREVKLDTSAWLSVASSAMTHTLGL